MGRLGRRCPLVPQDSLDPILSGFDRFMLAPLDFVSVHVQNHDFNRLVHASIIDDIVYNVKLNSGNFFEL